MREVSGQTIAYSTTGASSHVAVLRFISEYGLKARPVATGDVAGTITQTMSGQVDVGWSVAPFVLDMLNKGEARMIGRASDIAAISGQTIRVQIMNAQTLAAKKDAIARYLKAYNETVDWMYSAGDAVPRTSRSPACRSRRYAYAEGFHPEGEPADRQGLGAGGEHEGCDPVQVHPGAADRCAAQGADPDSTGLVTIGSLAAPRSRRAPSPREERGEGADRASFESNIMTIVTKKIDDITITALSDGVLTTSLDVVLGMERDEKERLAGLKTTDPLPIAVNAFLLERGGRRALIDAGAGHTMGPTLGKLPDNLRARGSRRRRSRRSSSPTCTPTIPTAWSMTPVARIIRTPS